eukprot:6575417-Prymnesium_polylepis.1
MCYGSTGTADANRARVRGSAHRARGWRPQEMVELLSITVCILIYTHSFDDTFQLWGRRMVRKDRHVGAVAAE